jgi:hypothetical protein
VEECLRERFEYKDIRDLIKDIKDLKQKRQLADYKTKRFGEREALKIIEKTSFVLENLKRIANGINQ